MTEDMHVLRLSNREQHGTGGEKDATIDADAVEVPRYRKPSLPCQWQPQASHAADTTSFILYLSLIPISPTTIAFGLCYFADDWATPLSSDIEDPPGLALSFSP